MKVCNDRISNDGFNVGYFKDLINLEPSHFWFRSRNRLIIWALKKFFPSMKSFLETGCGTGYVLSAVEKEFPEVSISGSDIYVEGLKFAEKRLKRTKLFQMDACRIPFREEFDVIGAFDVLEHIENDELALREFFNAIKPNGGAIFTVPQHQWLWSLNDKAACHKRRYSRRQLQGKLEKCGFKVIWISSFITVLLPLMVLSRMRYKIKLIKHSDSNKLQELKIHPIINFILEKICNIESYFIQKVISLPFGGSLICVAVKNT